MWHQYRELLDAAHQIENAWRKEGNACEAFPQIVWERTKDLDLSAFGDIANVTELVESAHIASLQHPSTFSDLYFKLYDNGKFWVEVLNWWGSDINVHDHNFSGVQFQLRGRSLNVIYAFDRAADAAGISVGELGVASAELWSQGDRSVVIPGRGQPHNVSHLDVPTVSLLIRTHPVPAYGGQRNYLAPDVAADYAVADIVFRKKIASLRLLARGDHAGFGRAIRRAWDYQTHAENLFTIVKLLDLIFAPPHVGLLEKYGERGETEALIVRAAAYHRAQQFLTNTVKYVPGLDEDEILAVSVLASAFSQQSFDDILADLARRAIHLDAWSAFDSIGAKLASGLRSQFRSLFELYGITRPVQPSVAV